jgi:hypothetical protein
LQWVIVFEVKNDGKITVNTETQTPRPVANSDLLAALDSWGSIARDEKSGFVERFCPNAWILTQVSWDSENMRFVYILDCGQHVADSVKITEWLEFLSALLPRPGANRIGEPARACLAV